MCLIADWDRLLVIRRLNIYSAAKWAAYLVPLLISLDTFINKHFGMQLPLPVNMIVTYVAALSFLLASLLVDIFCPDQIKEYQNFTEFLNATIKNAEYISDIEKKSDLALSESIDEIIKSASLLPENARNSSKTLKHLISSSVAKVIIDEAQPEWEKNNRSWTFFRALTMFCFASSAAGGAYISFYDAPRKVIQALAHLSELKLPRS